MEMETCNACYHVSSNRVCAEEPEFKSVLWYRLSYGTECSHQGRLQAQGLRHAEDLMYIYQRIAVRVLYLKF